MTRTIGIFLFDDVEVLDFAGPFEVFSVATRVRLSSSAGAPSPFNVLTIATSAAPVVARGGLTVLPQHSIASHPSLDVLLVPGGSTSSLPQNEVVRRWIASVGGKAEVTASVCTGAFLLARAGLLEGQEATTHWEDAEDLQRLHPGLKVQPARRWIDRGNVVTSAGISAGIDMSLHLVARFEDLELARRTARQMDYLWEGAGS